MKCEYELEKEMMASPAAKINIYEFVTIGNKYLYDNAMCGFDKKKNGKSLFITATEITTEKATKLLNLKNDKVVDVPERYHGEDDDLDEVTHLAVKLVEKRKVGQPLGTVKSFSKLLQQKTKWYVILCPFCELCQTVQSRFVKDKTQNMPWNQKMLFNFIQKRD
jgi:late competence protein required for DNA uptake (superfamily II DNA/RNA helicase)